MGNRHKSGPLPEPDSLAISAVKLPPGTIITPIADNSEATVFSTQFKSPSAESIKNPREIQSVLAQNHGKYIVRPKNFLGDGKVIQVKYLNPQPTKLYYMVRKQEGVDKWILNNE